MKKTSSIKTILCFGDSNTYGLKPDGSGRYDFTQRYPGRLQLLLGDGYRIIEEGCPGRTTVFEDEKQPYKKGLDYITPCLASHAPLDWVAVMLGTNDCKTAFQATSKEIAKGLTEIVKRIKDSTQSSKILVISTIHLDDNIGSPGYDPEFNANSVTVAKGLAAEYQKVAKKENCAFLDAASVATASPLDGQHLDENGHNRLAKAIAEVLTENTGS